MQDSADSWIPEIQSTHEFKQFIREKILLWQRKHKLKIKLLMGMK